MSSPSRTPPSAVVDIDRALPHLGDDRGLLSQVKSGRGRALKELRQYVRSHPEQKAHTTSRHQLEENNQLKRKMMWEKDSKSMCRRVDTAYRKKAEVTGVTCQDGSVVPDPRLVEAGRKGAARKEEELKLGLQHREGTSLLMPHLR